MLFNVISIFAYMITSCNNIINQNNFYTYKFINFNYQIQSIILFIYFIIQIIFILILFFNY